MKTWKVWIEVEEYDDKTDEYKKNTEPLDLLCLNKKTAHTLQSLLWELGKILPK